MMKITSIILVFLQSICFHLCGNECVKKSIQELKATSASQEYDHDFIALLEMIYGEGLLSQGGIDSIDNFFWGIDLNGLKMLDLGSDLGMYDIYLAKHHNVEIIGIDPQNVLIQKANANLEKAQQDLIGNVSFFLMADPRNLKQFLDNSFDIIFSKESILHVPLEIKESYFKEIFRVLKSGGKIIIMDWMHSSSRYSTHTQKMMEMDGVVFQLLTPLEYHDILKTVGFTQIEFTDTTFQHEMLSQQNIDAIIFMEDKIKGRFGKDIYTYSLESWSYQRDAFRTRELLTGIFKANKN